MCAVTTSDSPDSEPYLQLDGKPLESVGDGEVPSNVKEHVKQAMADYDKPGGAGDPTKKINDVVNKKLEDYGKPGGAGDSTQKIKDIVKQMLDAYYAPGGDGTSQEVKGVQAILDAYGITSLGIGTYFNNYPHQIAQIIFVVTSVRDCIVVNFSLLATMRIISTLRECCCREC